MPEKRKHHFVPAFALAGFTPSGDRDDRLYVHDRREPREPWQQTPRNVAHENDFYRIEGPDPLIVEDAFMRMEDLAAPIIRRIAATQELPTGTDLDVLINLVAGMAARVPRRRRPMAEFMHRFAKKILETHTRSAEAFEAMYHRLREENPNLPQVTYEQMRAYVRRPDVRYTVDRTWLVARMWEQAGQLTDALLQRKWTLLVAKRDAANFICSDNPVTLAPTREFPPMLPPGWLMPDTIVHAPLTRRLAIIGSFERASETVMVDTPALAATNRFTALHADRYIYSPGPDFIWEDRGRLRHASEFRSMIVGRPTS